METLKVIVRQPLAAIDGFLGKYDLTVMVHGGGYTGQAGAIRHGLGFLVRSLRWTMSFARHLKRPAISHAIRV